MKLCIMKQECLDEIKANLEKYYPLYFSDKTNEWMSVVCGQNPFQYFGQDIPDFKLAELGRNRSYADIDLENCKIVYSNLKFLTESQASDERLWAGLTNGVFYDYMRRRCEYDVNAPKEKSKQASEIRSRYFYRYTGRSGFFRNFLSKCWWVGRALYDEQDSDHFKKLDIMGSRDLSTKISDIFYSNTFSSNPEILDGIMMFFEYLNNEGIHYRMKEEVRPCLQHLNTVGGAIVLDCLTAEEVREELIDYFEHLQAGDDTEVHDTNDVDDEELAEETKHHGTSSTNENTEDEATEDTSAPAEEPEDSDEIILGETVTLTNKETKEEKKFVVEIKEGGKLLAVPEMLLGKKIGEELDVFGSTYTITAKKFSRKK